MVYASIVGLVALGTLVAGQGGNQDIWATPSCQIRISTTQEYFYNTRISTYITTLPAVIYTSEWYQDIFSKAKTTLVSVFDYDTTSATTNTNTETYTRVRSRPASYTTSTTVYDLSTITEPRGQTATITTVVTIPTTFTTYTPTTIFRPERVTTFYDGRNPSVSTIRAHNRTETVPIEYIYATPSSLTTTTLIPDPPITRTVTNTIGFCPSQIRRS